MSRRLQLSLGLMVVLLGHVALRAEAPAQEGQKYLRFVPEGKDGGTLETAVVTYKNDKGVTVHMVGAVHIADGSYYQGLNKLFSTYDVLLYEMVKPADTGAPRKEQPAGLGFVRLLQKGMKFILNLDYQLEGIDYTKKNFVHADLTAEEFARMQAERGESIWRMMLEQVIRDLMRGDHKRDQGPDMEMGDIVEILTGSDSSRRLKMLMARQFDNMDAMMQQLEGPNGSVIVTERNKAALKVLDEQIEAGKKNIGVFYGAAHLKDFDQRMKAKGFKPTNVEWRVAWDMRPGGVGRAGPAAEESRDEQLRKLQQRIEELERKLKEKEGK